MDALNGIAYTDDSLIASLAAAKVYTDSPDDSARVEVHLRQLLETDTLPRLNSYSFVEPVKKD